MAKSRKHQRPDLAAEPTPASVDVAAAIDKERRRLQRQLARALRTLATRLDQLLAAEASKGQKGLAKRRRQADDAATTVADLTDKLAILAGTGVDTAASAPVAAVKAVGAATARAAKPVAKAAGSAVKVAGTAAKSAGSAAGSAAKTAGSAAGSAAKAAGAATSRVAGSATRSLTTPDDADPDGAA